MQSFKKIILDTLFPIHCLACNKHGFWLCEKCLEKIEYKKNQVCPVCEKKLTSSGRTCFSCKDKSDLDGLLVSSFYKHKPIRQGVHYYKYNFVEDLHQPLGKIMTQSLQEADLPLPDIIISVPLHKRRLRWRGFNQAELLAEHIGKNLLPGFPIQLENNLLIRHQSTYSQMKIKNYSQRKENIKNAFSVDLNYSNPYQYKFINKLLSNLLGRDEALPRLYPENYLKDKKILLVDDIATTGATLFECARVLKKNKARQVFAIVIARQEPN